MGENTEYLASSDAGGNPLNGGKNYRMHLPPDIPARNYWSVIVYDNKTRLIIKNNQLWPSVHSNCRKLISNSDGSVDVWFGPKPPVGRENNWIKTVPRKGWYMILRLYGTLESWFDNTWKPGEIEEII